MTDNTENHSVDVFISYSRLDAIRAKVLSQLLTDYGWSTWLDDQLRAGSRFDSEIERILNSARAVLVLWSPTSLESDWVRAEAEAARRRNTLVPAKLDDVEMPLVFQRIQAVDLSEFDQNPDSAEFETLELALTHLCGRPPNQKVRSMALAELARNSLTLRFQDDLYAVRISHYAMQASRAYCSFRSSHMTAGLLLSRVQVRNDEVQSKSVQVPTPDGTRIGFKIVPHACFVTDEVVIHAVIGYDLAESNPVSLTIPLEATQDVVRRMRKMFGTEMRVAGWFIGKPAGGPFLSSTDLMTYQRFFPDELKIVMVIDPQSGGFNVYHRDGLRLLKAAVDVRNDHTHGRQKSTSGPNGVGLADDSHESA